MHQWLCRDSAVLAVLPRATGDRLLLLLGIGNLPTPVCFMGVVCCCHLVLEPGACVPAEQPSAKAHP